MIRTLIAFLFCLPSLVLSGQENPVLVSFSVEQVGDSVIARWTVKAGFSCNDVTLERSRDSLYFTPVYTYPGICGASSENEDYSYPDHDPVKNSRSYYRLNLGNYGYSSVVALNYLDYSGKGYSVFPMPFTSIATLYFDNPKGELFAFSIIDLKGKIIHRDDIETGRIEIDGSSWPAGVYIFLLTNGKAKSYKGKLVKK